MSNVIEKLFSQAKKYTEGELKEKERRLKKINKSLKILNSSGTGMIVGENRSKEHEEITRQNVAEKEKIEGILRFGSKYDSLDMNVLNSRDEKGFPDFFIFPPHGDFSGLTERTIGAFFSNKEGVWNRSIPLGLSDFNFNFGYYEDVIERLKKLSRWHGPNRYASISVSPDVIVPPKTLREIKKITKEFEEFWDDYFFFVEIGGWELNKTIQINPEAEFLLVFYYACQFWVLEKSRFITLDAFIVLHGTNTMGYTCAALSFALGNINKPVIVTGAQVPLGYLGSDVTTNLINALRLSVWGYHPVKGVMAVFGSKIISGVRVKKGTDFDYDPFSSFITGSLGQIGRFMRINVPALEKHVSYLSKVKPLAIQSRVLSVKKNFDTSKIASLTELPGMSPDIFKSLVENVGMKAFIFRAFGAGDPSSNLFGGFEYLKEKKIPIVVTTQAPSGIASFQVNETGKYLRDNDLAIPAFDMSIESMTVKLAWLIAQGADYEEIKTEMGKDLHGEINIENELL